jgi:hypothetical protein
MKKLIICYFSLIFLAGINTSAAVNLLTNGGFEKIQEGNNLPISWIINKGTNTVVIDNDNVAEGKNSLRLAVTGTGSIEAYSYVDLKSPLTEPTKLSLSIKAFGRNLKYSGLVIKAGTKKKEQMQWLQPFFWKDSFDWETFETSVTLNPGVSRIFFSIRITAPAQGTLYVDDCKMFLQPEEKPSAVMDNLIKNGEFSGKLSATTNLPAGWNVKKYDGFEAIGNVGISQEGCQSPDALLLQWQSGSSRFGAGTDTIDGVRGNANYAISAMIKTTKDGKGMFGVELYNGSGGRQSELFSVPFASDGAWKASQFTFTTLPDTAAFKIYCLNAETGTVSFDNVRCSMTKKSEEAITQNLPFSAICEPVEWTKVWNNGKAEFNTFADASIPLAFSFQGRKAEMKNPQLVIELPDTMKIVSAFCSHTGSYRSEVAKTQKIKRPEGDYVRYAFDNLVAFKIISPTPAWHRRVVMALLPNDPVAAVNKSYPAFWHLENDGKPGSEEKFMINILPPLPKRNLPKKFSIAKWDTMDYLFPDDPVIIQTASMLDRAGMNMQLRYGSSFKRGLEINKLLAENSQCRFYGEIKWYQGVKFLPQSYKQALGDKLEYSVKYDGVDKSFMCPEFFTDDSTNRELFDKFFRGIMRDESLKPQELALLDIEPWGTLDTCFCQRCRNKFAVKLGLKEVPDAATIRKEYTPQWARFRCENTARMIEMYTKIIREVQPEAIIGSYDYVIDFNRSDYQTSYYSVAVDPELNENYFDVHLPSYYHVVGKNAFDMMRLNSRKLKKGYLPIGAVDGIGYLNAKEVLNPDQIRQMMLASAVNGCMGYAIYSGIHIDGKIVEKIASTLGEISQIEAFIDHARIDDNAIKVTPGYYSEKKIIVDSKPEMVYFPQWDRYLASSAIEKNGCHLVSIFNYDPKQIMFASVHGQLPEANYTVIDPISTRRILPNRESKFWDAKQISNGFLVKVSPENTVFVIIRSYQNDDDKLPVASCQIDTQKLFDEAKNTYNSKSANLKSIKKGGLSIDLTSNSNGAAELEISSPIQKISIDYQQTGNVTGWDGIKSKIKLANEHIWMPVEARGDLGDVILKNFTILGNEAIVKLERSIPSLGVALEKTIIMDENNPQFKIIYKLTNRGIKNINFAFWVSNTINNNPPQRPIFFYQMKGEMIKVEKDFGDVVFVTDPTVNNGFKASAVSGVLSGPISKAKIDDKLVTVSLDFKQLMMYYNYLSPAIDTWEWMYMPITLEPQHNFESAITYTMTK